MSGELAAFVNTNVLVYAVSRDQPAKQEKAKGARLERRLGFRIEAESAISHRFP